MNQTTTLADLAAQARALEPARVAAHNARVAGLIADAKADRGYAVVIIGGGAATHAATGITRGHGGYNHPRARCQNASPRFYAGLVNDQTVDVTCKRCIASLTARS